MRIRRIVLSLALVVLAALAILLARGVRAWPAALKSGDTSYRVSPSGARWHASTTFPGVRGLLGVGDDLAIRRAIRLFRLSYAARGTLDTQLQRAESRAEAELALANLAESADPSRAAQASDLLGVLAFGDLSSGGGTNSTQADRAVSAFVDAVRLDPEDEAAKVNLELALRIFQATGVRPGKGAGVESRGRAGRGAGSGVLGGGY